MVEEENSSVDQQDQALLEPETSNDTQEQASREAEEAEQRKRNDAEKNWAEMRRAMREKDQQINELRRQFEDISNRSPSKEKQDEFASMAEDDILTVAQAKKLVQKMALAETQKVFKEREVAEVEDRLRLRHRDFDDVVTKENIELFLEQEKELAETLQYITDPYKQAETAYKMLKKFGKSSSTFQDKKKAEENSKKPVSVQAVTKTSAIGDAHKFENGLTPELKKQLYKEMRDLAKRA